MNNIFELLFGEHSESEFKNNKSKKEKETDNNKSKEKEKEEDFLAMYNCGIFDDIFK